MSNSADVPGHVEGGPSAGDVFARLQQLIAAWRGAERGQPLIELHQLCQGAVGPGGRHLLPATILLVAALDETTLQAALRRQRGPGYAATVRFRLRPGGRFDAALVPIGAAGEVPDRWLLALGEELTERDQVALYAHAVGHLLLSRDERNLGRLPQLDPRSGYTHVDVLAELRFTDSARNPLDRRVLETYPLLQELLGGREEPSAVIGPAATELRQRLAASGWRGHLVETPYIFTAGRVFVSGSGTRRGMKLRADALLRAESSLPIALAQTLRAGEAMVDAERRLADLAQIRLALPFAYLLDDGVVHEYDWTASTDLARATLDRVPPLEELWTRWMTALGLTDDRAKDALRYPYQTSLGSPRYYQEAAINRAVIAALQARRSLRLPRLLLTMATGTGKTKVAFQIAWKLKRARAIRNVLFITDRDYLLGQAMDNEFAPFGDARERIRSMARTGRDVLFATYQALAPDELRAGLYLGYPRDFFDLVIVDECHRGSAGDESNWRRVLDHFTGAVQIGLTATPRRDANVQTYDYFGLPIHTYSLRAGINDGFLAPYRVRRVLMGLAADGTSSTGEAAIDAASLDGPTTASVESLTESAGTLVDRTEVIAQHLANYLRGSDPLAKTIVFCVDQPHAERMRVALEKVMPEEVARYPGYIERIVSDEGLDGRRALGRFSTPDERLPVVVTTSRLLSTGVDVPTCKNIVLAKPIHNMIEFKQIIGRGTRLFEPDKTWFTILDYAGATQLFFDADFDGDPEVVEVEPLVPQLAVTDDTDDAEEPPADPGVRSATDDTWPSPAPGEQAGSSDTKTPIADEKGEYVTTSNGATETQHLTPDVEIVGVAATSASGGSTTTGIEGSGASTALGADAGTSVAAITAISQPSDEHSAAAGHAESGGAPSTAAGDEVAVPAVQAEPVAEPHETVRPRDGRVIRVIGEIVYELGPDGRTLRSVSYREYARTALQDLVTTPTELRARWLRKEQREEIRARLTEEGVDLDTLTALLRLPEADPLDLLIYVAFGEQAPTRRERADRVRREHAAFFARYGEPARAILENVLQKYVAGEAQDVSDPGLLRVAPLSEQGTFIELASRFGGGAEVRAALKELQTLLYSA